MWLDLFQGKSAPNLGFLGIEKQYLFRFNSALVRVVGYRCMGVCREKLHALLILPLLPWKRTWPSGSHPLLIDHIKLSPKSAVSFPPLFS